MYLPNHTYQPFSEIADLYGLKSRTVGTLLDKLGFRARCPNHPTDKALRAGVAVKERNYLFSKEVLSDAIDEVISRVLGQRPLTLRSQATQRDAVASNLSEKSDREIERRLNQIGYRKGLDIKRLEQFIDVTDLASLGNALIEKHTPISIAHSRHVEELQVCREIMAQIVNPAPSSLVDYNPALGSSSVAPTTISGGLI